MVITKLLSELCNIPEKKKKAQFGGQKSYWGSPRVGEGRQCQNPGVWVFDGALSNTIMVDLVLELRAVMVSTIMMVFVIMYLFKAESRL